MLNLAAIPDLKSAAMLVELHEHLRPGVESLLRNRFAETHTIELISMRRRHRNDLHGRGWVFSWWYLSFTNECRPAQQSWLFLQPNEVRIKSGSDGGT